MRRAEFDAAGGAQPLSIELCKCELCEPLPDQKYDEPGALTHANTRRRQDWP